MSAVIFSAAVDGFIFMNVLNVTMAKAQAFGVLSDLVVAFFRNVTLRTA